MKVYRQRRIWSAALLCVVVLLIIWAYIERVELAARFAPETSKKSVSDKWPEGGDAVRDGAISAVISNATSVVSQQEKNKPAHAVNDLKGIYSESARTLIRSDALGKVDYGLFRLRTECLSLVLGGDGVKLIKEFSPAAARASGQSELLIGGASNEIRLDGFSRSIARCRDFYEGTLLSSEEVEQANASPTVARYRDIAKALSLADDFNNPAAKAAFSQAVSEPLFGALSTLVALKVDYSELEKSYGESEAGALQVFAIPLILCKMGDDCGKNGIVTEQLCWINGICGDRVEDAIRNHLRDKGLNPEAMNNFVTRIHQGLEARDASIFRQKKK